jgi:hypothetical protein
MKLIHFPFLFKNILKGYTAITVYPFIFHKNNPMEKVTLNHERIHFEQIKKEGLIAFYFNYLKQYIFNRFNGMNHLSAYLSISYEQEAYENEKNFNYKVK